MAASAWRCRDGASRRWASRLRFSSWPIYKEMSSRAVGLIPAASQWTFEGVGHCVAQEAPALVLEALKAFETV
jgi:pimeloyl-ACP methyl ester carboxylesterase